jgi:hypothetical protein
VASIFSPARPHTQAPFRATSSRLAWGLVFAGAAAAILWFGTIGGRPERLLELPPDTTAVAVRDGEVYLERSVGTLDHLQLRATSVRGGTTRVVAQQKLPGDAVSLWAITADRAFYLLRPMGRTSADAHPLPNAARSGKVVKEMSPPNDRILAVPLHGGGTGQVILSAARISRVAVVGNICYWLRGSGTTGPLDLMATFLDRGKSRCLVREWTGTVPTLARGNTAVYWSVARGGPRAGRDLAFVRAADQRLGVLAQYPGTGPPTELGERLYWFEANRPGDGGRAPGLVQRLVSADLHGGNRSVLLDLGSSEPLAVLGPLSPHQGRLYCTLTELRAATAGSWASRSILCSLDPRTGAPLRRLVQLPTGIDGPGYFDGDAYYFTIRSTRERWGAWSPESLPVEPVVTLYRYRLPP